MIMNIWRGQVCRVMGEMDENIPFDYKVDRRGYKDLKTWVGNIARACQVLIFSK